jgi:predicted metalloprotease with PDZ domain
MGATAILTGVLLLGAGATPSHSASSVSAIRYEVTFDATTRLRRALAVKMRFRVDAPGAVRLSLPAWTPGAYEISNFARKVSGFTASAEGRSLGWDKADFDTWRVQVDRAGEVLVRFDVLADSLDNAMAWSTPDFTFFNGTNVLLFPEETGLDFSARLSIRTEKDWQVVTGMTETGQPREYVAASYHELVDMPIFVGRFDLDSTQIAGRWYRLASYPEGALAGRARDTFWEWTEQMLPPMVAVFEEVPWETYTTLLVFDERYPGGSALEHGNSHVGIYNTRFIGSPLLASITAHEIFHAWNVKRLRPAELLPYDYARPQATTLLWVSEGITDYYADLALVRGGIIPPAFFYRMTSDKVQTVSDAQPVALEDASLSTWIQPSDGSHFMYYPKGSLAGLLLDILIRDESDNRRSLDDVLRGLYRTTYKNGAGFTEVQWWEAVREAAGGRSFEQFYRRYIDGRDPYPWTRILPLAGLVLKADTSRVPRLGVSTSQDSNGIRVVQVVPGSAAAEAGVVPGDYLVRIGAVKVEGLEFGSAFRARYRRRREGSDLPVTVRRGRAAVELPARLVFADDVSLRLDADQRATSKAQRIRDGILRGLVDR